MISHITTNFQGRKNFSFTSEADPWEGPGPHPLLFLDQTEARKVENIFLETGPSPLSKDLDDAPHSLYLKVWIRHCTYLTSIKPHRPKQPRRRFRVNKPKIKYPGVDGLLCFSNLAPERFPRISGLFSSRRPGWNFSYEPKARLRVVTHFSSGILERTKRERAWKSPHARKGDDFHARSRFVRSTLPEEKWGTTRSLTQGEIHPNIYRASPVNRNRAHVKRPSAVLFASPAGNFAFGATLEQLWFRRRTF